MDSFQPPFRSFSSASTVSLNSMPTNITRVPSAPLLAPNQIMNKVSSAKDHMFYKCSVMLLRLSKIDGIEPYMGSAYAAAERLAEQQALALSQQLQQLDGATNAFRASVGSGGFSIYLDHSNASTASNVPLSNNVFTFTAGVLPANLSVDPVTQLWKLFQQGTPLCMVFNDVKPENAITVVRTDDLRMSKKAVYDFLIAVKMNLDFEDESMFTISNVFSDNTHDLLKIVSVVERLLEMKKPKTDEEKSELSDPLPEFGELKITDERSKVFRELIQTERKYVLDLELLMEYKNELQNAELISSEQIHVLFPNINDIVDFHRRFLNGLECNIDVPTKYQRIGSVFIHASGGPFKAYEPWTIGQIAAIDLISKEAANFRKSSSLLDPGFELQLYILKPIQRLCKYPLLLKLLIKAYSDSSEAPYYNELLMAGAAMKEVANQVNEAQRRAENVGFLQNLVERVKNWRGFNLRDQGDLLYHSTVAVKDGDSEKEYVAFLFENIIFFFVEVVAVDPKQKEKKKREILSSRKKSVGQASASTTNLLESLNSVKDKSTLELKGRVYISEIYNISSANMLGYTLVISWSGKKESGSFTLRYRTEEPRNQWEACLRSLKSSEMNSQIQRRLRDSRGSFGTYESFDAAAYGTASPASQPAVSENPHRVSNASTQRHNSSSSTFSMMKYSRGKSDGTHETSRTSSLSLSNGHIQESPAAAVQGTPILIKLIYNKAEISEPLSISSTSLFHELHLKISSHVASSNSVTDDVMISKLKYKDEDGDFVVMDSHDDWVLAVDMLDELEDGLDKTLTIWVS